MPPDLTQISTALHNDIETLWEYHQMHHQLRPCSVGIGLGSHDLGVATFTAELFHRNLFPLIVFSGANSPTTSEPFPRGEAIHYREQAIRLGVPSEAILVERRATNTADNIEFSRQLLIDHGITAESVMLICRPYQQRRAYATCKRLWSEVEVICESQPLSLRDYLRTIGDPKRVIDMLVGDTQRIIEYPKLGYAIEQGMPSPVFDAYARLVQAGFTSRLINPGSGQLGRNQS